MSELSRDGGVQKRRQAALPLSSDSDTHNGRCRSCAMFAIISRYTDEPGSSR